MKMRPAVELSYCSEETQRNVVDRILETEAFPSHDQAIRIRKADEQGYATYECIQDIMDEQKPNQKPKFKFSYERLDPLIPQGLTVKEQEDFVVKALETYTATKLAMQKACSLRAATFETAWQEAKSSGYIRQERLLDETTGRIGWGYSVAVTPEEIAENCSQAVETAAVSRKEQTPAIRDVEAGTQVAESTEERQAVQELVEENIGYAQLLQATRTAPLYYHKEDIDGYVRLIVDTVCSTLPTMRIGCQMLPTQRVCEALLQLRQEHILYVMECLSDARIEYNPRAYKLTALYNAAITYSEYAMGLTA